MRLVRTPLQSTEVTIFSCSLRLPGYRGYTMHGERLLLLNRGVPSVRVVDENQCATTLPFEYTCGRGVQVPLSCNVSYTVGLPT